MVDRWPSGVTVVMTSTLIEAVRAFPAVLGAEQVAAVYELARRSTIWNDDLTADSRGTAGGKPDRAAGERSAGGPRGRGRGGRCGSAVATGGGPRRGGACDAAVAGRGHVVVATGRRARGRAAVRLLGRVLPRRLRRPLLAGAVVGFVVLVSGWAWLLVAAGVVAEWTAPSTPRVAPTTSSATVNPVQAWATLANNLFALQRNTWANMAGFPGTRNTQDR